MGPRLDKKSTALRHCFSNSLHVPCHYPAKLPREPLLFLPLVSASKLEAANYWTCSCDQTREFQLLSNSVARGYNYTTATSFAPEPPAQADPKAWDAAAGCLTRVMRLALLTHPPYYPRPRPIPTSHHLHPNIDPQTASAA